MAEHLNDVDLTSIHGFSEAVRANPALGKLTMKARSTWQRGTKALVTTGECSALGQQIVSVYRVRQRDRVGAT
jgi:hypothetical protein